MVFSYNFNFLQFNSILCFKKGKLSGLQIDLSEMENRTDNKITALKAKNNQTSKAMEITKLNLEGEYHS